MGKLSKKLISIITTLAVAVGFTFTNVAPAYAAENTVQETSVVPDDDQKAESAGKLQASSVQDGVILHAWCWSLDTIKENMAEIAAAEFSKGEHDFDASDVEIYSKEDWETLFEVA